MIRLITVLPPLITKAADGAPPVESAASIVSLLVSVTMTAEFGIPMVMAASELLKAPSLTVTPLLMVTHGPLVTDVGVASENGK